MVSFLDVLSQVLLFGLVFGMSATVDINNMREQVKNRNAILSGVLLQFGVLPFLGFCVVRFMNLSHGMGITLLVVTSSPGGSYSNWWCSLFNADLALSVTMTAISTIVSCLTLPANLLLYARFSYGDDIVHSLDWTALFVSLAIVISGITLGLFCSARVHSHKFNIMANRVSPKTGETSFGWRWRFGWFAFLCVRVRVRDVACCQCLVHPNTHVRNDEEASCTDANCFFSLSLSYVSFHPVMPPPYRIIALSLSPINQRIHRLVTLPALL